MLERTCIASKKIIHNIKVYYQPIYRTYALADINHIKGQMRTQYFLLSSAEHLLGFK